ncbi:MAG: response regulator [Bdellovibrionales bacterium]|nr:response regulator [Bdellovibrionales bacterium]
MFPSNTKILIVDDLKTIRSLLREFLKKLGYSNIIEADDGKSALIMLKAAETSKSPYGLIISDWNMPNKTGLSLLEDCRKDQNLRKIPFLMVTIESEKDYVLQAVKMGVSDFIVKPFTIKTIEQKLAAIWSRGLLKSLH